MGQNMPDIHLAPVKVNRCDQAVFVATDVKDDLIADHVRLRKGLSQFDKRLELRFVYNCVPCRKRAPAVGMQGRELVDPFAGDDMHR